MTENRRQHPRHALTVTIRIRHPAIGEKKVKTKDISDGGIFIIAEPADMPAAGEIVIGQVMGMMDDAPEVKMKIVRIEGAGIGLEYIDP